MRAYLASSDIIDWQHPGIQALARELADGASGPAAIARACFTYVRDEIKHSSDHGLNPVTCKASEVLRYKTGFCYAKSHLLTALLRANGIPAGLCYQRLSMDDEQQSFCLHGLNAVHLPGHGWYRMDARGNRPGIDAQFTPPVERLAFAITIAGEADLPEVWPEPLPVVTEVLQTAGSYQAVLDRLPDIELVTR